MKRRCAIKETPELEIILNDKTYNILFSNSLFIQYEELFGSLVEAFDGATKGITTCEFFSNLMYAYFKFTGEDITLDGCKVLIIKGSDGLMQAMTECLMESIMLSDNDDVKKKISLLNKQLINQKI